MLGTFLRTERILICVQPATISLIDLVSKKPCGSMEIPAELVSFGEIHSHDALLTLLDDFLRKTIPPGTTCAIALDPSLVFTEGGPEGGATRSLTDAIPGSFIDNLPYSADNLLLIGPEGKRMACNKEFLTVILQSCRAVGGKVSMAFAASGMQPTSPPKKLWSGIAQRFPLERRNLQRYDFLHATSIPSPATRPVRKHPIWHSVGNWGMAGTALVLIGIAISFTLHPPRDPTDQSIGGATSHPAAPTDTFRTEHVAETGTGALLPSAPPTIIPE